MELLEEVKGSSSNAWKPSQCLTIVRFLAFAALGQGLATIRDNCNEDVKADIEVHVYISSEI